MPALAIAEALVSIRSDVEPVLVGARRGVERTILPARSYQYHLLSTEPIYRNRWWRNWKWPVLSWRVLREARRVLEAERPVFAVSTGGYAAGPVMFQAHRMHIPFALLELNAHPGITTRWLSQWARQIFLGFPEAERHLRIGPGTTVHAFGNPIRPPPDPRPDRTTARAALGIPPGHPVLLITGGSQGARAINEAVAAGLRQGGFDGLALLWSTGKANFQRYQVLDRPPLVQLRPFWDPIAEAYAAADLVVARSGGSTAELCAWGLPSILVPLPHAAAGHQQKNAEALAAAGAAIHLPESELSETALAAAVQDLMADSDRLRQMGTAAEARGRPDAAKRTASALLGMVP